MDGTLIGGHPVSLVVTCLRKTGRRDQARWWDMNPLGNARRFSLRALLLWVLMVSLSFGMFRWAARLDSQLLDCLGVGCLGLSAVLALIALQRCWRYATVMLLVIYAGVYVVLSANGRYEPAVLRLNHVKWYSWAPAGFVHDYDWNSGMLRVFLPLWYLDVRLWHLDVRPGYSGPYPINDQHVNAGRTRSSARNNRLQPSRVRPAEP